MGISWDQLCPCGHGKKFNQCCGQSIEAIRKLTYSIHEIGHAATIPERCRPHVSLQSICSLCQNEKSAQDSEAHANYESWDERNALDEVVYSLAGGASEVACGLAPRMERTEYGVFPEAMTRDLLNLREELGTDLWEAFAPHLPRFFQIVMDHFKGKTVAIFQLSRQLRDRQVLGPAELNLKPFDRDGLMYKIDLHLESYSSDCSEAG